MILKIQASRWLDQAHWRTRPTPRAMRSRYGIRIDKLFRNHYAFDPFLSEYSKNWALAAVNQEDVAHYASTPSQSDSLPAGYAYLTEFSVPEETRYTGDFRHDIGLEYPDNPGVPAPLSAAEGLHVARIQRFRSVAGCEPEPPLLEFHEGRRWLYEARVIRGLHQALGTTVVRSSAGRCDFLHETDIPDDWLRRVKRLPPPDQHVDRRLRHSAADWELVTGSEQPVRTIKTREDFETLAYSKKLQMVPLEALVASCLLGFSNKTDFAGWTHLVRKIGWTDALVDLGRVSPQSRAFDPIAQAALPMLSDELERSFVRLERGFGVTRQTPDHAIADLLDQMVELAGIPPDGSAVYRSGLEYRAMETCDLILANALTRLGVVDLLAWRSPAKK